MMEYLEYLEGNDHELIEVLSQYLPGEPEENYGEYHDSQC
jgi:hypothetical protein